LHPNVKGVSGKYFARDSELAKRLWSFSEELVKIYADMSQTTQASEEEETTVTKDVFQDK
jgi:hypothetical protein